MVVIARPEELASKIAQIHKNNGKTGATSSIKIAYRDRERTENDVEQDEVHVLVPAGHQITETDLQTRGMHRIIPLNELTVVIVMKDQ